MAVQCKKIIEPHTFSQNKPKYDESVAMSLLNTWIEKETTSIQGFRLINIETIEFFHPNTMTSSETYKFIGFKIWYECS